MRLGLYGGTFDPVHLGHLLVARAALEEAGLDRLFFIPAAQSPFKPGRQSAPAQQRALMLRLALAGKPWCGVDEQEIRRGGVSYTIETVRNYRERFPDAALFYLVGADHVPLLSKWREAAELARAVEFLVIPRPGTPTPAFEPPFRGRFLQGVPCAISSSMVRERAKAGRPIDHLVPPAVAEAIANNALYL